ncbi:MAG: hypothetical protein CTY31_04220 [Hyphomicrobium sp.]|nr:MAG: hypothetical protein CTY39_03590 [Hyphomicrobium sp.]PPD00361.1 MAG: hypothetical protein CTY31_04220 [Hyphomicrobium sp.]
MTIKTAPAFGFTNVHRSRNTMFVGRQSQTKYQIAMIDKNAPETKLSDQPNDDSDLKKLLRVRTVDLMRGTKEIVIEHDGKDYRLRVTSLGKLILTR